MRGLRRDLWKAGIAIAGMLLFLLLMAWIPASAAGAEVRASGFAGLATVTVQAAPTANSTIAAETANEQLRKLQRDNDRSGNAWFWNNGATILSAVLSTLVIVSGVLIAFWRWRGDQRTERQKRVEERFQSAVTGLGDEKKGARIGAAILLRTFLHPGYEQFYTQTFDLAAANLRLPRIPHPPKDPHIASSLTPLRQALIVVFKEAFPLARSQNKGSPQSLDATGIQLDTAYLSGADLRQVWMPQALLRKADLSGADLSLANLFEANLSEARLKQARFNEADLSLAKLNGAYLVGANLSGAYLSGANLSGANLFAARLSGAELSGADLNGADLNGADLSGARLCEAKLISAKLIQAKLSGADLDGADLGKARLNGADLSKASLAEAQLGGAQFFKANLSCAYLYKAHLSGTYLGEADLSGANLDGANIEDAQPLKDANLRGVKGLTNEQKEACKAKGAIIDEDPTTSSSQSTVSPPPPEPGNGVQAPSAPPAQESIPTPETGESSAPSSKPGPES